MNFRLSSRLGYLPDEVHLLDLVRLRALLDHHREARLRVAVRGEHATEPSATRLRCCVGFR